MSELRPRSVFCIVAGHHRDRAVAEDACAGRFTYNGVTLELGLEPDWLSAGLDDDKEWAIECGKFYYGLDLACAFSETGESRFLAAWERLVLSWISTVPVGADPSHVAGRRIQNWIYAWDVFASAPGFPGLSAGSAARIASSLAAQVRDLRGRLTPERNHRTLELYALFIAALALPDLDPDGTLLDFAVTALSENLLSDILPDGVHRERSTHYHMITLRTFVGARENARRFGVTLPDGYDERLARACEFALHCHRPDGGIPALSDADGGSYLGLLERAGGLLGHPDFLWASTAGGRGAPPEECSPSFPLGGYFMQRSGWGTNGTPFRDERFLVFDCGPLGDGSHGHYDLLNVEIAAGGRPLVVDPGRYSYSEASPNWRRWFRGTAAHNTVCVDGLDQTPYARGKPDEAVAQARFLGRHRATGLDVLHGEVRSPCYEVVHTRRVVFVAGEYWLLEDRLRGDRAHRYDLRFHLSADAWQRTEMAAGPANAIVCAPGLALVVARAGTPRLEAGWVAESYGVKYQAPVVSIAVDGSAEVTFTTLVVPLAPGRIPPSLAVHGGDGATVVEVRGTGPDGRASDWVGWRSTRGRLELGPLEVRGVAAWLRQSESGEIVVLGACDTDAVAGEAVDST